MMKKQHIKILWLGLLSCGLLSFDFLPFTKIKPCEKGTMTQAWLVVGIPEPVSIPNKNLKGFSILAHPKNHPQNFISNLESYYLTLQDSFYERELSKKQRWPDLNKEEQLSEIKIARDKDIKYATYIHLLNNSNTNIQLFAVNSTKDTVILQRQGDSIIGIPEAVDSLGKWKPIRYWRTSICGNSYFYEKIAPNTQTSFICSGFSKGNYATKIRFKLLGKNKFYYSNQFNGMIDYCEFIEDSSAFMYNFGMPNYKLDSLRNFVSI